MNMHAAPSGGVTGAIGDIASEAARRFGAKTAYTVVMPNGMYGKLTFEDVDRLSDDFAVYLRERCGLAAGDRVALQTPNCLAFPVAALGILKAGCVLVNTNPLYTADEMERQFADAGISAIVIVDMFADKLADVASRMPLKHVIVSSVSEFMPRAVGGVIRLVQRFWDRSLPPVTIPHERFAAALREGGEIRKARGVTVSGYTAGMGPDALACLQYTGGTTGVSKGAMLTHGNILANIAQGETCFAGNMRPGEEVMLTALPLYHILAFTANFLMFHKAGANNILIPNPRPISNLKRAFENHNITWMTGVNTLFNALNNEFWFAESPPKTLRGAVAGYGLTETSPIVTFNAPGKARPGSIGLPMGATEVALFDDEGRSVPDGEPGELAVKGPQVMKGYWNKPEETAKAIRAGWFLTGDIATRDADGYLRIVDRKKDMILVSGFNVYPNEVEDVIARHPGVLECAVIGMPDGASGEAVAAYVVPRDGSLTADALREHCKAHLTGYKTPRSVTFRETLPKSNVGKILRKDLRAEVLAGK